MKPGQTNAVDGIVFDEFGNPKEYHVLKGHPGSANAFGAGGLEYDKVPAAAMIHWFRDRQAGPVAVACRTSCRHCRSLRSFAATRWR